MDEDEGRSKKTGKKAKNLDPLSVGELRDYILELKAEIDRVEQEIGRKEHHKTQMASLFKK